MKQTIGTLTTAIGSSGFFIENADIKFVSTSKVTMAIPAPLGFETDTVLYRQKAAGGEKQYFYGIVEFQKTAKGWIPTITQLLYKNRPGAIVSAKPDHYEDLKEALIISPEVDIEKIVTEGTTAEFLAEQEKIERQEKIKEIEEVKKQLLSQAKAIQDQIDEKQAVIDNINQDIENLAAKQKEIEAA